LLILFINILAGKKLALLQSYVAMRMTCNNIPQSISLPGLAVIQALQTTKREEKGSEKGHEAT
jgi:hypothetical protein